METILGQFEYNREIIRVQYKYNMGTIWGQLEDNKETIEGLNPSIKILFLYHNFIYNSADNMGTKWKQNGDDIGTT